MTLIKLAIKNILRKRVRSIAIVIVAALAAGLIFSASSILKPAKSSLELGMDKLGADIMVVPSEYELRGQKELLAGEPSSFYMDVDNLEKVAAVPGVKQASAQLFMASAVLECCYAPDVLLVGYNPEADFTIKPWIRFTVPGTASTENIDPVEIGSNLSYLSSDEIRFYGKQFRIGSVLQSTGLGFFDKTVFMDMATARKMIEVSKSKSARPLNITADQISSILIKVDRGHIIQNVAADIEKRVPGVIAIRTREPRGFGAEKH